MVKRHPTRLSRRVAQDLAAVRQHVNVTEDKDLVQHRRVWRLSCGQMIDLVVNDIELGVIALLLDRYGLDIEAACQRLMDARS